MGCELAPLSYGRGRWSRATLFWWVPTKYAQLQLNWMQKQPFQYHSRPFELQKRQKSWGENNYTKPYYVYICICIYISDAIFCSLLFGSLWFSVLIRELVFALMLLLLLLLLLLNQFACMCMCTCARMRQCIWLFVHKHNTHN